MLASQLVMMRDDEGKTPLFLAAEIGTEDTVRLLMRHNPTEQVMVTDNAGMIPLMIAAKNGHVNVMEILLCHNLEEQIAYVIACGDTYRDLVKNVLYEKWLRTDTIALSES